MPDLKAIFGIKLRRLRESKKLPLRDLSLKSGLSISYLSEIESGKKYPKPDKIMDLAAALDVEFDDMVSMAIDPASSWMKSSIFQEFPFQLFGMSLSDVIGLVRNEPEKASAFVRTLLEVGQRYDITKDQLFYASLRSYQKLNSNYFPELESSAEAFRQKYSIGTANYGSLARILTERGVVLDDRSLQKHPLLSTLRSVWVDSPPKLMIHPDLSDAQKAFIVGHELAYSYLNLKQRPLTSPWLHIESFEQVLNNFRASYFAGALLLPKNKIQSDLEAFFGQKTWKIESFEHLLTNYEVTPEMMMNRLTQVLPKCMGLPNIYFLRLHHEGGTKRFELSKELNMTKHFVPYGIGFRENYCHRWLSVKLLQKLAVAKKKEILVGAQKTRFIQNNSEFLTLAMARPLAIKENHYSCVSIGILLDAHSRKKIQFAGDPSLSTIEVHETCERCPLTDCQERVAKPTIYMDQKRTADRETYLKNFVHWQKRTTHD